MRGCSRRFNVFTMWLPKRLALRPRMRLHEWLQAADKLRIGIEIEIETKIWEGETNGDASEVMQIAGL